MGSSMACNISFSFWTCILKSSEVVRRISKRDPEESTLNANLFVLGVPHDLAELLTEATLT